MTNPTAQGVVYTNDENQSQCSDNPEHCPGDDSDVVLARFGYQYESEGIRLTLADHDPEFTHSLAHGLRLGLQKISGVTIRDVNEYVGADHVDVFDVQEGGAAVSRTLVDRRDGSYRNFEIAHSRLSDIVRLQPTSNAELADIWGFSSGSEVYQYLSSEFDDYYYRDDEKYIRATDRAEQLIEDTV